MNDRGFSLIEVMVGMMVLTVAMLGLLGLFVQAVVVADFGQDDLIAKQKAREAMEGIYTARNTKQINFSNLSGASSGGVFLEGPQPLQRPGPDGLAGTADDAEIESIGTPGPDGLMGTADDQIRLLTDYQREIVVSDLNEDLKEVTVVVSYSSSDGRTRTFQLSSYVSRFR